MAGIGELALALCDLVAARERLTAHQRHCRRLNECEACLTLHRRAEQEQARYFALADGADDEEVAFVPCA